MNESSIFGRDKMGTNANFFLKINQLHRKLFLFFIALFFSKVSNASSIKVERYLDSCSKYLEAKRPELVVQFNLKADAMAKAEKDLSYYTNFRIQNNYVLAFSQINQEELKEVHLRKLINLIREEQKKGDPNYTYYLTTLGSIAGFFNGQDREDSARKYYEEAIMVAKEFNDSLYLAGSINNMGLFVMKYKNWELAKPYFDEAISYLNIKTDQDSILFASIRDNVADYFFYKKDSLKAVDLVEENLRFLTASSKSYLKIVRWGKKLLPYYIRNRQFSKAEQLISYLEELVSGNENNWSYENRLQLINYRIQISKLEKDVNQLSLLHLTKSKTQAKYLKFLKKNNRAINGLLNDYQSQYVNQELEAAEKELVLAEKKERRSRMLYLVSTLVLIIILGLIIINYRRMIKIESKDKELKSKQLIIETLEKEKLHDQLEHKNKDFTKLLMQSSLQEDWGKYLIEKLQLIQKNKEDSTEEIKELIIELKQKTGLYQKVHELQKGMKEVNSEFFENLESQFPELSRAEKETCGLIRMNLDAKEIALLRNINPSSVRKIRQRIRKKLELDLSESLDDFIQKI